jgi:TctA family transporter
MKKLIIISVVLLAFASFAYAQMGMMGGQMGQGMKTGEGQPMQMTCPKMQGGQQMQMMHCQDMTQIITGMMDIQEKMLMGVKPEEKDKMMQDMKQMKEKIQEMKGTCKCMQGGMMGGMMGQQPPAGAPEAAPAPAPAEQHKH